MTNLQRERIQKKFIKKAEKRGLKVHKNNIKKAKPLNKVCGFMTAKHPTSLRNLIAGR